MKTGQLWIISSAFLLGLFLGFQKDVEWLVSTLGVVGDVYLNLLKVSLFPLLVTCLISNVSNLIKNGIMRYLWAVLFLVMALMYVFSFLLTSTTLFWNDRYVSLNYEDRNRIIHGIQIFEDDISINSSSKEEDESSISFGKKVVNSLENILDEQILTKKMKSQESSGVKLIDSVPYDDSPFKLAIESFFNIIPTNIYGALVNGEPIQLIVFSIFISLAIALLSSKRQRMLIMLSDSIQQSLYKIFLIFVRFFPLAFVPLMANFFAQFEMSHLSLMTAFLESFYVLGFVIFILTWIFFALFYKKSFIESAQFLCKTGVLIVFAKSDLIVLPNTLLFYTKNYFRHRSISSVAFPITLQFGHQGFFIYFLMASFFCASYYAIDLQWHHYGSIFVYSFVASLFPRFENRYTSLAFLTLILEALHLPSAVMLAVFTAIDLLVAPMRSVIQLCCSLFQSALVGEGVMRLQHKSFFSLSTKQVVAAPSRTLPPMDVEDKKALEHPVQSVSDELPKEILLKESEDAFSIQNVSIQEINGALDETTSPKKEDDDDSTPPLHSIKMVSLEEHLDPKEEQQSNIEEQKSIALHSSKWQDQVQTHINVEPQEFVSEVDVQREIKPNIQRSMNTIVEDEIQPKKSLFKRFKDRFRRKKEKKSCPINYADKDQVDESFNISLRSGILIFVLGLLIIYGGLIGWVFYQGSRESIYRIARNMMDEISSNVAERITHYLDPVYDGLEELNYLVKDSVIDPSNKKMVLKYIKNDILTDNKNIKNAYIASADGNFSMIRRMSDGTFSVNTVQRDEKNGTATVLWKHKNPEYESRYPKKSIKPLSEVIDPRVRSWFKNALTYRLPISWSDVYILYHESELGITCALSVFSEKTHELVSVIGLDLGLEILSDQIHQQMNLGRVFIVDNEFELVSLSAVEKGLDNILYHKSEEGSKTNLKHLAQNHIENTDMPLLTSFYQSYTGAREKDTFDNSFLNLLVSRYSDIKLQNRVTVMSRIISLDTQFLFSHDNENYLTSVINFSPYPHIVWKMGVLLKESELMSFVHSNNVIVVLLSLFIFLVSILLAQMVSRSVSRPLVALSEEMKSLQTLDFSKSKDEIPSVIHEVEHMRISFEKMKSGLTSFKKYVPAGLVKQLVQMGTEAKIAGHKQEMTIFFSDVKGFTSITESFPIGDLLSSMDVYFSGISDIIDEHKGTIDKYIGDAIMAFWNAPVEVDDHPSLACLSSLKIQRFLSTIKSDYRIPFDLPTRIGVHTDEVIVGNIGSTKRLNYTVMGDGVNLCSRLEGLNKLYHTKIIVSHSTYLKVSNRFQLRCLDKVAVKGKIEGVLIYELIGEKDDFALWQWQYPHVDKKDLSRFLDLFNDGIRFYFDKEWTKSMVCMTAARKILSDDYPARIIQARAYEYIKNPPQSNWNGVFRLFSKK